MNKPTISPIIIIRSKNNEVPTNLTRVSLASERNFIISKNDNSHFNNYPNFLAKEKQNQDTDSDNTLGTPQNSVETSDEAILINNNDELEMRSVKGSNFDDEDNKKQFIPSSKKPNGC